MFERGFREREREGRVREGEGRDERGEERDCDNNRQSWYKTLLPAKKRGLRSADVSPMGPFENLHGPICSSAWAHL